MATVVKMVSPDGVEKRCYSVDARDLRKLGWKPVSEKGAVQLAAPPEKLERTTETLAPATADPPGSQTRGGEIKNDDSPVGELAPVPPIPSAPAPPVAEPGVPSDFGPGDILAGGDVIPPQGAQADDPTEEVPNPNPSKTPFVDPLS